MLWNENRTNGITTIPSTNQVLRVTGGSKRDVNRHMQRIRGILAERITPKRVSTTRGDQMRSTTAGSDLVVSGSDRKDTLGVTDEDLDNLRRTTTKRTKTQGWEDPSK